MSRTPSRKGQHVKKTILAHQVPTSAADLASPTARTQGAEPATLLAEPPATMFKTAPTDPLGSLVPAETSPPARPAKRAGVAACGVGRSAGDEGHRREANPKIAVPDVGKHHDGSGMIDYLEAITRYLVWRGHPIKHASIREVGTALATLRSTRRRRGPRLLLRDGFIHATDGFESRSSGVRASKDSAWWENAKARVLLDAMVERRVREAMGARRLRASARH